MPNVNHVNVGWQQEYEVVLLRCRSEDGNESECECDAVPPRNNVRGFSEQRSINDNRSKNCQTNNPLCDANTARLRLKDREVIFLSVVFESRNIAEEPVQLSLQRDVR